MSNKNKGGREVRKPKKTSKPAPAGTSAAAGNGAVAAINTVRQPGR